MITILTLASKECSSQSSERNPSGSMDDPRYNTKNRRYTCEKCIVGEREREYLCRHCVQQAPDPAGYVGPFYCRRCSIGTDNPHWIAHGVSDTPFNCRGCRNKALNHGNIKDAAVPQIHPSNANNRCFM